MSPCTNRAWRTRWPKPAFDSTAKVSFPLIYDDLEFGRAFRVDFVVEREVLVELKSVERLAPLHHTQLLTYLKLSGLRKGLLINFNAPLLKDGLQSIVV